MLTIDFAEFPRKCFPEELLNVLKGRGRKNAWTGVESQTLYRASRTGRIDWQELRDRYFMAHLDNR
jgi:hypothetical protein